MAFKNLIVLKLICLLCAYLFTTCPTRALTQTLNNLSSINGTGKENSTLYLSQTGTRPSPEELQNCLNSNQPNAEETTWETVLKYNSSRISVVKVWWTQKRRPLPMTIVTQLSWSRKWQLKALCNSYPGPVSAAIYSYTVRKSKDKNKKAVLDIEARDLKYLLGNVSLFYESLDIYGSCALDLLLAHEIIDDSNPERLYPVNQLRNYARLQARTPLIGLFDVDLVISANLASELKDAKMATYYMEQASKKLAVVLPAFIPNTGRGMEADKMLVEKLQRMKKSELAGLYKSNAIRRFDPDGEGHKATNYGYWFHTALPYLIALHPRYEPWVIVDRLQTPWHDVRYRGYGKNKIIHILALNYTGFRFIVHPNAFVMHRPHTASSSKAVHIWGKHHHRSKSVNPIRTSDMFSRNAELMSQMQSFMRKKIYAPQVDWASVQCRKTLSWWKTRPKHLQQSQLVTLFQ